MEEAGWTDMKWRYSFLIRKSLTDEVDGNIENVSSRIEGSSLNSDFDLFDSRVLVV